MKCIHCNGNYVRWGKQITANGKYQIAWYCLDCKQWAESPPIWLPHHSVKKKCKELKRTIEDIPIVTDYSAKNTCVICGQPGETHHWAPQAMSAHFGDEWFLWPVGPLCPEHHRQWHDIVTPYLTGQYGVGADALLAVMEA